MLLWVFGRVSNEVSSCIAFAVFGHLGVLKYLHENGCAWDDERTYTTDVVTNGISTSVLLLKNRGLVG
jgi:hypothetical protein